MNAHAAVGRAVEAMPPHIADTLLDDFDMTLKTCVDNSALDRNPPLSRDPRPGVAHQLAEKFVAHQSTQDR